MIEKGRRMLSREQKIDFVPRLCLFCEYDKVFGLNVFAYHMGFALVAKIGSYDSAKDYLIAAMKKGAEQPYQKIGISKELAKIANCTGMAVGKWPC